MQLAKKRQQQQEDIEIKKKKIEEENSKISTIGNKFQHHYDAVEALLKTDTIGLVTLEDMKKKQEKMIEQRQQQLALERKAQMDEEIEKRQKRERQKNQVIERAFEWTEAEIFYLMNLYNKNRFRSCHLQRSGKKRRTMRKGERAVRTNLCQKYQLMTRRLWTLKEKRMIPISLRMSRRRI